MGVLSARSFVAPILDKKNLIAIVLIAVFFAVYRLSGGSIETGSNQSRSNLKVAPVSDSFFDQMTESESISPISDLKKIQGNESARPTKRKAASSDLLDDILVDRKPKEEAPTGSNSQLDDIERSLGLR